MNYDYICRSVVRVERKYAATDPFTICRDAGIIVLRQHMGTETGSVKGFFLESRRIRTITINADLPLSIQRVICAHELGHAVLHRNRGMNTFHEVSLFDEASRYEKEANLFAAELLLDDYEVIETLNRDGTFFSAASELGVPSELLDFKFRVMKWKGYKLMESPVSVKSNFLKNVEIPEESNDFIS